MLESYFPDTMLKYVQEAEAEVGKLSREEGKSIAKVGLFGVPDVDGFSPCFLTVSNTLGRANFRSSTCSH